MRYNVAQLMMEPIGSTRRYQFDGPIDGLIDDPIGGPGDGREGRVDYASGTVQVLRTHQGLLVRANLETRADATCSRCLTRFSRLSTVTLEEESFPTVDPSTGQRMFPPEESEGVVHIDASHVLDLSDVIRQYVLTDEPIKPLCSEGCLGLCPECGTNLNEEHCKCSPASADPRWGALVDLLHQGRAE